jgi:hypothetical protein
MRIRGRGGWGLGGVTPVAPIRVNTIVGKPRYGGLFDYYLYTTIAKIKRSGHPICYFANEYSQILSHLGRWGM